MDTANTALVLIVIGVSVGVGVIIGLYGRRKPRYDYKATPAWQSSTVTYRASVNDELLTEEEAEELFAEMDDVFKGMDTTFEQADEVFKRARDIHRRKREARKV